MGHAHFIVKVAAHVIAFMPNDHSSFRIFSVSFVTMKWSLHSRIGFSQAWKRGFVDEQKFFRLRFSPTLQVRRFSGRPTFGLS
jgi:hypothetical protein